MSANLVVDLRNTTQHQPTIVDTVGVASSPASGEIVGRVVDLLNAGVYCNMLVKGGPSSGVLQVQVQTSDSTASGTFTDPTSGLAAFPAGFHSGGILIVNSGLWASGNPLGPPVNNAPLFCSGGMAFGAFQRPHRYARAIALSGAFDANVAVSFISQLLTAGSGFGSTQAPGSGSVNV